MPQLKKVAIACGGTGGHLYPGISIAEELKAQEIEVRLYVSNKPIDQKVLSEFPYFHAVVVPVMGWPGLGPKVISFFLKLMSGYLQALRELKKFQPDVVLGMGGFTCAPLLLVARQKGIATFLHESNAIPGKVTRQLASWVKKVFIGFENCRQHLEKNGRTECVLTGTPVRSSLKKMTKLEAAQKWELDLNSFTVAVMGGSQGARGLNRLVCRAATTINTDRPLQWLHLAGPDAEEVRAAYAETGVKAVVADYCHEMEAVYGMADVIISRAGAASLNEIAYFGIPSVLVPYPHAAEYHQDANAKIFSEAGAAKIVYEGDLDQASTILADELTELLDESRRAEMSQQAKSLSKEDSVQAIVKELTDVVC
ncbi:MAG: undecaprenyldiphospho-muramoylpentapeptide beta-N-acetylglucosaminyltransferase [Verrucomicrobiota bacterium]